VDSQYDLSQVTPTSISAARWWVEIEARGLNHVTNFGWSTEKKPDVDVDFPGVEVLTSHLTNHGIEYLIWMDNCLIMVNWSRDELSLIFASAERDFKTIEAKFRAVYPQQIVEDETRVSLKFWFNAPNGMGAAYTRLLAVPEWSEVEENYGQVIRDEMARLTAKDFRPAHGGQLMLWQGPPGTGKTFAIRALVREWVKWCDGAYIVDPDSFFHNANYMMQVMLDETNQPQRWEDFIEDLEEGDEPQEKKEIVRWKLIILEDSGELLASDAKQRTGQALSRLLNIADGLIGQGLRVLILITTNEELDSLHEAVSRPGRCASKIVFPRLSKEESNVWLKKRELAEVDAPRSLAELYGEQEGFTKKAEKDNKPYQRELGFSVKKETGRRAMGFNTGKQAESPAPPVGPPVEEDENFVPASADT
jgi:hypothetical protein